MLIPPDTVGVLTLLRLDALEALMATAERLDTYMTARRREERSRVWVARCFMALQVAFGAWAGTVVWGGGHEVLAVLALVFYGWAFLEVFILAEGRWAAYERRLLDLKDNRERLAFAVLRARERAYLGRIPPEALEQVECHFTPPTS